MATGTPAVLATTLSGRSRLKRPHTFPLGVESLPPVIAEARPIDRPRVSLRADSNRTESATPVKTRCDGSRTSARGREPTKAVPGARCAQTRVGIYLHDAEDSAGWSTRGFVLRCLSFASVHAAGGGRSAMTARARGNRYPTRRCRHDRGRDQPGRRRARLCRAIA